MNRKYNLKLDLQFRCNNSTMKFNQFDNNTSDFFIKISNGGKSFDVEKAIVVLAVIKPSGKVSSQFVEIENGLVYADLKPNMRDEIGTYTAQAMLILEDERVVTDVISYEVEEGKIFSLLNDTVETSEEFTLLTDMLSRLSTIEISEEQRVINEAERILSEENRKIEEAKRVEAELIRQHEEADRAKYDATRESNENIRKQNESIRLANETNRIDKEAKRVEEEAKRVEAEQLRKDNYNFMTEDEERRRSEANAHKEAEALRVQAETNRVNEEAKRRTTEQARVSAENTRVSNENIRKTNEETRQNNETKRVEAETQRQNRYNSFIADAEANANNFENYTNTAKVKEEERKSNELDRKSQEARRVSNEVERISNENTRKANEKAREKNETSRQYVFENKVDEVDKKIIEINATKDNFVSSINTKVDTKISELNTTKDNFVSSVNTKVDSKISELDNTKSDMATSINNKVNEVENRFNALTSKQQQDAEVIDARDGETSLKARLDRDIEKAKQVYVDVEGSHISSDSSVGYAKDVEILGNTVQSASNLADIRSVGDKVEGQELYEIPVLSVGKNLFDGNKFTPREAINQYSYIDGILTMRCDGQAYRRVDYILPNTLVHGKRYILTANVKALEYSSGYTPGQNFGYGYYNGGSADYYGSFDASSNTTKLEFVYNEQGENVIGFHNEVKEGLTKLQWSNIQIEEGTVATQYEPYQEDKLTILSPVQLEKGDILKEVDGVWGVDKNIVDTIITGNESNTSLFTCNDGVKKYFGFVKPGNIYNIKNGIQYYHITNKLKNGNAYNGEDNVFWLFFDGSNTQLRIRLDDSYTTKEQYMEWLKSNNILVKYITTQPQFIPLPHDQQIKLRTFANKTNISFGCEIEGTIKAQVPKSLGATVNTHTEQIRSLNNELNRVKKLEESTVSTVTTESDFITVEATSNGYFEDVKLKGKTLTNIVTTYNTSKFSFKEAIKQEDGYYKLQYGATVNNSNVIPRRGVHLYKPNTTYTIIVDIKENTTGTLLGISAINSCIDPKTISERDFANLTGISTITFKTRDDITISDKGVPPTYDLYFGIWKDGGDLSKHITFKYWVLEGDHTQNPPSYFEGLKSVGQDVDEVNVLSCGKNLLNIEDATTTNNGVTFSYSNGVVTLSGTSTKDYITSPLISIANILQDGKCYRLSSIGTDAKVISTIRYMDGTNAQWADKVLWKSSYNKPFVYIQVQNSGTNCNGYKIQLQLEEVPNLDTQVTPYEPYVEDKKRLLYYNEETQTWEKPVLREWDSIEKHANGKYYYHQRSGEEDYTRGDESVSNYITDMTTTVKLLAQEKVYECTNIDLITYNGETNFIVESGAITPKTTLKVHNNISNVVSLLQKKVSLLESNVTSYMTTQNRLMLASRYNSDAVSFKVDYAVCSENMSQENYDTDLYNLILNNILVGKDNYDYNHMFNIIMDYASWSQISWDQFDILVGLMDIQHNPPIEEIPTDDEIVEEIPNEIM